MSEYSFIRQSASSQWGAYLVGALVPSATFLPTAAAVAAPGTGVPCDASGADAAKRGALVAGLSPVTGGTVPDSYNAVMYGGVGQSARLDTFSPEKRQRC